MTIVRAALVQAVWTGDKESMIAHHEEQARLAAAEGARVICFQELFYGPYFCQVQDAKFYEYAESVPGPVTERFAKLAAELGMVMILPVYELEQPGFLYNTAAVIDADGTYLGKYRKHHLPHLPGFWEKFYFRPGNGGYPVFDTAVGRIGVYICYDRHFPEGWRALGLNGAQIVFNPSATSAGLSDHLWKLEQPAAAVANEYYIGAINRVGIEEYGDDDFYGTSYFVGPEGRLVGEAGDRNDGRAHRQGPGPGPHRHRAQQVGVLPRPQAGRVRRPDPPVGTARSPGEELLMRTLIRGGTVVNPTGPQPADVLIDGETIAGVLSPGGRGGADRRRGHRRGRLLRDPRRRRRPHAHGDAVRRHDGERHVRDGHRRRGLGRHDHDHRLRHPDPRRGGARVP